MNAASTTAPGATGGIVDAHLPVRGHSMITYGLTTNVWQPKPPALRTLIAFATSLDVARVLAGRMRPCGTSAGISARRRRRRRLPMFRRSHRFSYLPNIHVPPLSLFKA